MLLEGLRIRHAAKDFFELATSQDLYDEGEGGRLCCLALLAFVGLLELCLGGVVSEFIRQMEIFFSMHVIYGYRLGAGRVREAYHFGIALFDPSLS